MIVSFLHSDDSRHFPSLVEETISRTIGAENEKILTFRSQELGLERIAHILPGQRGIHGYPVKSHAHELDHAVDGLQLLNHQVGIDKSVVGDVAQRFLSSLAAAHDRSHKQRENRDAKDGLLHHAATPINPRVVSIRLRHAMASIST